MSSYYGVIFSRYWTGQTGRALRARGGKDAQLLGVYLFSNDYMNMLGLYSLKLRDVTEELGLTPAALTKAFAVMRGLEYAFYDYGTGFVWVREMATFRLSIRENEPLKRDDNKTKGAQQLYTRLPANPWLAPFFDRYGKILHLKTRRNGPPQDIGVEKGSPSYSKAASEGLGRGFEASKQNQEQIQRSGSEKTSSAADAARPRLSGECPDDNYGVIEKLAHLSIDVLGLSDLGDVREDTKRRCAEASIAYNSAVVGRAVDSAVHQRSPR